MTASPFRAVAPVSAVCAAFRAQPSAYPQGAGKSDVAPTCGGVAGTASAEGNRLRAAFAEERAASGEAGESQGVVRTPWQSHLPAVQAVWGFRAGGVERAKTALLGSEAQIVPLFQEKQRGYTQKMEEKRHGEQ